MELVAAILSIIMIDLVLSGDNAVVIALAARELTPGQQRQAIFWGVGGAVILRVVITAVAVVLLKIPFLKLTGGVLLVWIAIKLLRKKEKNRNYKAAGNMLEAVKTIVVADFIMSLDNVLAVAGVAKGNIPLLIIGLAISIPIMVFGSRLVMLFMNRFPVIVYLGAGILGWTAGEMIVSDPKISPLLYGALNTFEWLTPIILTLFVIGFGKWLNILQEKSVVQKSEG